MTTTDPTAIDPAELPGAVQAFLRAHAAHDAAAVLAACHPDVVVVDEGRTHRGPQEVTAWMRASASAYRYTTTLVGARRLDGGRWVAVNHLEGDFPGGVADLGFDFTVRDGRIEALTIA